MENNKEPIEESSFVNIITPRKLYHGSNSFYNTLKATGIDFGNSFQKMGFSLYTWTKVESAMGWAIFCVLKDLKTIDDNLKQINYMNGCLISQTPLLTTQGYEYLKNNISNYSKKDLTFYIYTIDTKNKDYEYGLGHSSNTPNCITIRTKETLEDIPYEKCDEYILDIYLIDKYCIVKDEEPTMKEYGRNKRLMSFFMSYDFMYQGRIKKEIKNAIDSGELNIGDDILKFMKSKNIDIHKVSFKERFVDMFINEATSMIDPITESYKSVSVLDAKSTLTKGFKVKKLNKDIRYIDLHSEEGKRIFMSDPYCKDYSKYIINREWIGELAVDRNKIIGHIFVSTSKKEMGFIHSFWINEKYRGYGISRRLLDDAINIYGGYDLVVDKDNEIAKRIYRNKGFVIIGYCDNDTRYHMILEDKVPNKSMIINESLVLETSKYHELYHLSETNLNDMVLKPKVPSNYFTKNGYEDNKTKRVCFTNSIDNSLRAITYKCTGNRFYVHVPETLGEIDLYHPTIREVPDCKITGEVWYTKPIKVKCIGIIEVIGDRGEDGIPFKYGNKTAELYDWDWIWVQKYDNVFESKDIFEKGDFSEYAKYADLDSARGPIEESGISSTLDKDFKSKPRKSLNSFTKKRLTKPMIDEASKDSKLLRHLDPSDDNCFGFYDGNKLACYVSVNKEKDDINWITALEVMPEYRGCGLSKQLLDFATKTLHANALGVSKSNEVALSLYKKYGFKISKESEKEVQSGKRNNYRMYYGKVVESKDIFEKGDFSEYAKYADLDSAREPMEESTFIEGDKDDTRYYPIFIFLSYTNSNMAKIIKAFTHDPYSHSSISFDTELNHMISFNKEGMVIEDINTSIWKKNKDVIKYSLYMYMATVEEYESIRNFVNHLLDRRNKLKYNMLGLTNFIFGRGSEREDRFFCSEFIASAISAGNNKLINTKPYMTSPCMLARNKNFKFVKKGLLKNYDSKVVDNIIRDILEEGGYTNVVIK